MVGVLSGYWIFGFFIDDSGVASESWLNAYWILGTLTTLAFLLLFSTALDEHEIAPEKSGFVEDFMGMLRLALKPLVFVFVVSAFLYVLLEQGIGTWLPTFNNKVLQLKSAMSVQIVSIFAGTTALGRLLGGQVLKRFHWFKVLSGAILGMMGLVLLILPLTHNIEPGSVSGWMDAPIAAYIFPAIGLFLGPIYPAINSVILTSLPKRLHSAMTGLIVIFSALGGTTGSVVTGFFFGRYDGQTAFYLTLIPMAMLLVVLYFFNHFSKSLEVQAGEVAG